jgi:hypothetical protein
VVTSWRPLRVARRAAPGAALAIAVGAVPVQGLSPTPTEHQVKAAFLYNFANFVEWPAVALGSPDSPLRVCVVGADPFGDALDDAFRDQVIQSRKVEVSRGRTLAAVGRCHIVFLSRSEEPRWPQLLAQLRGTPALTVADGPPLVRQGGMVNFVLEAKRVRFEINRAAAEDAGLRISSKLLALARLVDR